MTSRGASPPRGRWWSTRPTLHESDAAHRQARFNAVAARWTLLGLDEEIIERARRPFPAEPIRALDAIHLASAVIARKAVSDLAVLTLDGRVRTPAHRLGFPLIPTDAELGFVGERGVSVAAVLKRIGVT